MKLKEMTTEQVTEVSLAWAAHLREHTGGQLADSNFNFNAIGGYIAEHDLDYTVESIYTAVSALRGALSWVIVPNAEKTAKAVAIAAKVATRDIKANEGFQSGESREDKIPGRSREQTAIDREAARKERDKRPSQQPIVEPIPAEFTPKVIRAMNPDVLKKFWAKWGLERVNARLQGAS